MTFPRKACPGILNAGAKQFFVSRMSGAQVRGITVAHHAAFENKETPLARRHDR